MLLPLVAVVGIKILSEMAEDVNFFGCSLDSTVCYSLDLDFEVNGDMTWN